MTYNELVKHINNGRTVFYQDEDCRVYKVNNPNHDYAILFPSGYIHYIEKDFECNDEDFYVYNWKAE